MSLCEEHFPGVTPGAVGGERAVHKGSELSYEVAQLSDGESKGATVPTALEASEVVSNLAWGRLVLRASLLIRVGIHRSFPSVDHMLP